MVFKLEFKHTIHSCNNSLEFTTRFRSRNPSGRALDLFQGLFTHPPRNKLRVATPLPTHQSLPDVAAFAAETPVERVILAAFKRVEFVADDEEGATEERDGGGAGWVDGPTRVAGVRLWWWGGWIIVAGADCVAPQIASAAQEHSTISLFGG